MLRDGPYVELSHLDTAAYLHDHGIAVANAWRESRYKFRIVLYDPDKRAEQLAVDYTNSCCARQCDAILRLKRVIHKFSGRDDTPYPAKPAPSK